MDFSTDFQFEIAVCAADEESLVPARGQRSALKAGASLRVGENIVHQFSNLLRPLLRQPLVSIFVANRSDLRIVARLHRRNLALELFDLVDRFLEQITLVVHCMCAERKNCCKRNHASND